MGGIDIYIGGSMFKKMTSTARIMADAMTPIQWGSVMMFGGQYVNPPKKSKAIVYTTKSHSRIEQFETYDYQYSAECKKLWTQLVIDLGTEKLRYRDLNEWQRMLLKKFGKLIYKA
jgi:hypothetical protein